MLSIGLLNPLINTSLINARIKPYSLKNKNTNNKLLISILNPLISSLSPSNKSKGARFLSNKHTILHNLHQIQNISNLRGLNVALRDSCLKNVISTSKVTIKETSKDNLCSILRIPPNFEKLLDPLHPIKITK